MNRMHEIMLDTGREIDLSPGEIYHAIYCSGEIVAIRSAQRGEVKRDE